MMAVDFQNGWFDGAAVAIGGGVFEVVRSGRHRVRRWWEDRIDNRAIIEGQKGVPGLREDVTPLRPRLLKIDQNIATLHQRLDEVKTDVSGVLAAVEGIGMGQKTLSERVEKLFPNGGDTNEPGDLVVRTARAVGAYREGSPPSQ